MNTRMTRFGLRDGLLDLKRWTREAFARLSYRDKLAVASRYSWNGSYGAGYQKAFDGLLHTRRNSGKQGG